MKVRGVVCSAAACCKFDMVCIRFNDDVNEG
jgi:hypothetical protein